MSAQPTEPLLFGSMTGDTAAKLAIVADDATGDNHARLIGKRQGVSLALSYVQEAQR